MNHKQKLGYTVAPLIVCVVLVLSSCYQEVQDDTDLSPDELSGKLYRVLVVIDGDTIKVMYEGSLVSVRLIGVDTPETVHPTKPVEPYGRRASLFTRSMVNGRDVYLIFSGAKWDIYDRLLAYVYRSDGLFVNLEIIRQGYGRASRFPHKRRELFLSQERKARKSKKGMWAWRTDDINHISPEPIQGAVTLTTILVF